MSTPPLTRTSFSTSDLVRGEDGELYHLPTLRALHATGRLSFDSAGYQLLAACGQLSKRASA
ncbi:hypothetical protein LAJ19_14325 (plasmid) [Deinococcus taeanensis]|uniref:hypothetical protein n=1 Tax=Deinococcus taeanensis TaxID=2737050 RepID=UPI001CDC714C|nr:hypothetical protein [Deinococcus taeanensis]UBV44340.1 hypothetical protein LAJ19_14325 [Deinococcus taeanensis]